VGEWKIGMVEDWNGGRLEWKIGMEDWNGGIMEGWKNSTIRRFDNSTMEEW